MKKLLLILFVAVLSGHVFAGGLSASFTGSRFEGSRLNDRDLVFESYGVVDGSNNLIDFSGANNLQWSEEFDNAAWTKTNVTVTADQVQGPRSWTANADLLTPGAADSYVCQDDTGAVAGETHTCSFWLRSVVGNVDLSIHAYNQTHTAIRGIEAVTVTPHWRRYMVQGVLVAGDTAVGCCIGGNNTWSTGENICAVRGQSQENDEWRSGAGLYHYTDATTKPTLDLTQNNSPTMAKAHLQDAGGNKLESRSYDGVNQDYRLAHHNSMNIFDTSHTMTFAVLQDVGAAGSDRILDHQTVAGGVDIYSNALAGWRATYVAAGGGTVNVDCPIGTTNDGMLHFVQVVRNGNCATCYLDGVMGVPVDVAGHGDDVNATIYLGSENANYFDGTISYSRIDNRALNENELRHDRETMLGIGTNRPVASLPIQTLFYANQTPLNTVTIKFQVPVGNSLQIHWGDGTSTAVVCNNVLNTYTHDYTATGQYAIRVVGDYDAITRLDALAQAWIYGDIANLAGLTNLVILYLSTTSVSGDIANLAGLTNLVILYLFTTSVSGDIANLAGLTNLTNLRLYMTSCNQYTSTPLPPWANCNQQIYSNGLDSTEVDNWLIDLANGVGVNGTLNIAGTNAARTAASNVAKAALLAAGWAVTVNE